MKITFALIIDIAIVILIATGIVWLSINHQKKFMRAAEAYEQCVAVEYKTTPHLWYAEQGEYPTCDISRHINN